MHPRRRYPLAPLAQALGIEIPPSGFAVVHAIHDDGRHDIGKHRLAEMFGRDVRTIQRWATQGIPEPRCDELAVTIAHRHPLTIWADWDDDQAEPLDGFPSLDDVFTLPVCREWAA